MSWSTSHSSKSTRPPIPSNTPRPTTPHRYPKPSQPIMSIMNEVPSSRTTSLAGRKRPRESTEMEKPKPARRTKSLGDKLDTTRDREAFQRGLIAVFVPNALQESLRGNLTNYNDLLGHFMPTIGGNATISLPPLLPLLRAITAHVSMLSPISHGSLVTAILSLPWATGDDKFVKSFVGFCGVLVSSEPSWSKEVVGMAVKGLAWQPVISESTTITRRLYHARYHLLLSHLISLIPTLPNVIGPLVIRHFPHKREPEISQTTYVRNACELTGYCPELLQRIWGEVVDRMLRIDVEITQRTEDDDDDDDDEDDEDDEEEEPIAGPSTRPDPFDLLISENVPREASISPPSSEDGDNTDDDPDPEDLSSGDEGSGTEEPWSDAKELFEREKKKLLLKSMRAKLDGMLSYFFDHLAEYMGKRPEHLSAAELAAATLPSGTGSGSSTPTSEIPTPTFAGPTIPSRRPTISPADSLGHFQTLLNLFSRQILPTSSTQHIPFILFLTSSFSSAHADLFLGLLVQQALYASISGSSNTPISTNQRVAATVYIGGIVCRARFVNDDQARTVIAYLLAFIDGKLHQSRTTTSKLIDELPLFYAVCQAVMLIFCFRWRAFITESTVTEGIIGEMDLDDDNEDDDLETKGLLGNGKWMKDLEILQKAITSELNPLLGCNPTIVQTFAKVAHQTNFLYCYSIIEANPSAARSSSSNNLSRNNFFAPAPSGTGGGVGGNGVKISLSIPKAGRQSNLDAGLDSYFPFDPYDLPRSGVWIERLYRTWDEVAMDTADDSDDEEESSDEDEEGEEEDEESEINSSMDPDRRLEGSSVSGERHIPKRKIGSFDKRRFIKDNGLSSSLEGMSISPTVGIRR